MPFLSSSGLFLLFVQILPFLSLTTAVHGERTPIPAEPTAPIRRTHSAAIPLIVLMPFLSQRGPSSRSAVHFTLFTCSVSHGALVSHDAPPLTIECCVDPILMLCRPAVVLRLIRSLRCPCLAARLVEPPVCADPVGCTDVLFVDFAYVLLIQSEQSFNEVDSCCAACARIRLPLVSDCCGGLQVLLPELADFRGDVAVLGSWVTVMGEWQVELQGSI